MNNLGLVHLYYGDGKGKSTAAAGLCLRALAAGFPVTVIRFLKSGEYNSGEALMLEEKGAVVINGKATDKFVARMDEEEKRETRQRQDEILNSLLKAETQGLLVLDEAVSACSYGLADEELLRSVIAHRPQGLEIVLTGREPKQWMIEAADYITEFKKVRHPYDKGIWARKGIEY